MRSGKRLSGAVIAVPRRMKLCLQSSEVNSSPFAGLSSWGWIFVPGRSLKMNSVRSAAGISYAVFCLKKKNRDGGGLDGGADIEHVAGHLNVLCVGQGLDRAG